MDRQMGIEGLEPSAWLLLSGLLLDFVFGDPQYSLHPIRLIGRTLTAYENALRRLGWDGYIGGCLLLVFLSITWIVIPSAVLVVIFRFSPTAALVLHALVVFSLMAIRDL